MQSKVVLTVTAVLILLPALYLFFFEYDHLPFAERVYASIFQSITTRTAGFNTADLTVISETGLLLFLFLMIVGGSPGSTAGGVKTTTLAVLCAVAISVFRKKDGVHLMRRRIEDTMVKQAITLFITYLFLFLMVGAIMSAIEGLPLLTCLFESASAIGTVGLSLGITPMLSTFSKAMLIGLMFIGRVGGLTLVYAALGRDVKQVSKLPIDTIAVG